MDEQIKEKLKKIAELKREDIGSTEDEVRYNLVVPILKCFGHTDFSYERERIDVFIKNLPDDCKVIVETKRYNADLNNFDYITQLERYAKREHAPIAILSNGEEIKVYTPYMIGRKFEESILCVVKREELADESRIEELEKFISKIKLENGETHNNIREREAELRAINTTIEKIKKEYFKKIKEHEQKLEEHQEKANDETKIIDELKSEERTKIQQIIESSGLPMQQSKIIQRRTDTPLFDKFEVRKGTTGKQHVQMVVDAMNKGLSYQEAVKGVAYKSGITPATISSQCTRELGISTNEFIKMVQNKSIQEKIELFIPTTKQRGIQGKGLFQSEMNSAGRVIPNMFEHEGNGIFYLRTNPSIKLDLNRSIREIEEQLKKNSLWSQNVVGFYYLLRKREGLIRT